MYYRSFFGKICHLGPCHTITMNRKDYTHLQIQFGKYLKYLRETKGLTLREVAKNCELDDSNISKIEQGQFNIQLSTLVELSRGLGIAASDLLNFEIAEY